MLRISLSNFAAINTLVVDSAPYLELPPSSAMVVAGRSGAGKTLLVWALYYTPLILAEKTASRISPRAADTIRRVTRFIARVTGTRGLLDAILENRARITICRMLIPGREACLDLTDTRCCEHLNDVTLSIMREAVLVAAVPLQLRSMIYALSTIHGEFARVLGVKKAPDGSIEYEIKDVLSELEERDARLAMLVRLVLARSIPPVDVTSDVGTWSTLDALDVYNLSPEFSGIKVLKVDGRAHQVKASWGQVGRTLLGYTIRFLKAAKEALEADEQGEPLTPVLVVDDAFEGYAAGDAIEAARRLERLAQQGYSILITSHRAEIPALASEAEGLWELLIATYGIDALSRIAKVPPEYRLVLLSFRRVSKMGDTYALKRIQEVILGVRERGAGFAEAEAAPG